MSDSRMRNELRAAFIDADEDCTNEFKDKLVEAGLFDAGELVHCDDTDRWHYRNDCYLCESCEEWHSSNDDFTTVITSLHPKRTEEWCDCCTSNNSFYCDVTENNYSDKEFSSGRTDDGDICCVEALGDNWCYWNSDESYHTEPEPEEDEEETKEEEKPPVDVVISEFQSPPPAMDVMAELDHIKKLAEGM